MKKTICLSTLLAAILVLTACQKEPPVAKFSIDKATAKADEKLTFINQSENADSYAWDFGDGKKSTDENPTHTYTSSGDFIVKLTATGGGGVDSTSQTLAVIPNLTGVWRKTLAFAGGGFGINGTMNLTQHDDNTLTGSYVYEDGMGSFTLKPTSLVTGNKVVIEWVGAAYKFDGTISTNGKTMSGQILYEGSSQGTWTAKKL